MARRLGVSLYRSCFSGLAHDLGMAKPVGSPFIVKLANLTSKDKAYEFNLDPPPPPNYKIF